MYANGQLSQPSNSPSAVPKQSVQPLWVHLLYLWHSSQSFMASVVSLSWWLRAEGTFFGWLVLWTASFNGWPMRESSPDCPDCWTKFFGIAQSDSFFFLKPNHVYMKQELIFSTIAIEQGMVQFKNWHLGQSKRSWTINASSSETLFPHMQNRSSLQPVPETYLIFFFWKI